jgi:hypothetical protein
VVFPATDSHIAGVLRDDDNQIWTVLLRNSGAVEATKIVADVGSPEGPLVMSVGPSGGLGWVELGGHRLSLIEARQEETEWLYTDPAGLARTLIVQRESASSGATARLTGASGEGVWEAIVGKIDGLLKKAEEVFPHAEKLHAAGYPLELAQAAAEGVADLVERLREVPEPEEMPNPIRCEVRDLACGQEVGQELPDLRQSVSQADPDGTSTAGFQVTGAGIVPDISEWTDSTLNGSFDESSVDCSDSYLAEASSECNSTDSGGTSDGGGVSDQAPVLSGSLDKDGQLSLNWSAVEGAAYYLGFVSESGSPNLSTGSANFESDGDGIFSTSGTSFSRTVGEASIPTGEQNWVVVPVFEVDGGASTVAGTPSNLAKLIPGVASSISLCEWVGHNAARYWCYFREREYEGDKRDANGVWNVALVHYYNSYHGTIYKTEYYPDCGADSCEPFRVKWWFQDGTGNLEKVYNYNEKGWLAEESRSWDASGNPTGFVEYDNPVDPNDGTTNNFTRTNCFWDSEGAFLSALKESYSQGQQVSSSRLGYCPMGDGYAGYLGTQPDLPDRP